MKYKINWEFSVRFGQWKSSCSDDDGNGFNLDSATSFAEFLKNSTICSIRRIKIVEM